MILLFFRQCSYKCTKENWVRDADTSQCTSNPVSTKLNWVDCVKVTLGNRGMTVEAARLCSSGAYVTEQFSRCNFCMVLFSFGPPSRALMVITWRGLGCRYIMRLGQTVKRAQLLKIKAQVSSIWAKGCMLDDCVRVI